MDLCITAEEPFQLPNTKKPFSPVAPSQPAPPPTTSPHHLHPLASPSPSACRGRDLATPKPQEQLEFDLIVYDANNDSSLTHPWELPPTPLRVPLNTTKAQLLAVLRTRLPVASPCPPGQATTTDVEAKPSRSHREAPFGGGSSSNSISSSASRHPKLTTATLYWTFRGEILPISLDDSEWHYRNPITKTDLLTHSEQDWFLVREMMSASSGALKCYIAIRGEKPVAKKTGCGRWFGSGR